MRKNNNRNQMNGASQDSRLHSFSKVGFDEPTRSFIKKIRARKPVEPKEWHKELKSYEHRQGTFYVAPGFKLK